jgi:hypothetical protein
MTEKTGHACDECGKPARQVPLVVETITLCQAHEKKFHEVMARVG